MAEGNSPKFLTPDEINGKVNRITGVNSTANYHILLPAELNFVMICKDQGNAAFGVVYKYGGTWYIVGIPSNYATISGSDIVITGSYSVYKIFY